MSQSESPRTTAPEHASAHPPPAPGQTPARVRVWDLPVRLFHWSLLICMVGAYVTMEQMEDMATWHFRLGYAVLALVLFRVVWGFAGDRWTRFSSFPPSPARVLAYLKGGERSVPTLGHNPLGAFSVYALLASVALQAVTGLFTSDEIAEEGPLTKYVSSGLVDLMGKLHNLNVNVLIGLIALHVLAIVGYAVFKKRRLVPTMVLGDRDLLRDPLPEGMALPEAARDNTAVRVRAAVIFAVCVAIVWGISGL